MIRFITGMFTITKFSVTTWAGIYTGLILASLCVTAQADVVELKNGRRVEGLISELPGRGQIDVMLPGSKIAFKLDDVTTYTLDTKAVNFVISANIALIENKPEEAWQYLIYAMDDGAPLDKVKSVVMANQNIAFPISDSQKITNRNLLTQFCTTLRRFGQTDDDLLALCAKTLFVLDEFKSALETYNMISNFYYTVHPEEKTFVVDLIQREIGEDISMGRIPLALQKAEIFASIEPAVAESCKVLAYMNWAGEEKRLGNYEESLRICRDDIFPIAPTIAQDRAVKILDLVEAQLNDTRDFESALKLAQEYTAPIAPDATDGFILSVIEKAVSDALVEKDWEKAKSYIKYAPTEMKDKALATTIDRIEFRKRIATLRPDDYNAHFKLAEWAMSRGLLDESIDAYEVAAQSETLKQDSQLQIDLINRQRETDQFRIILAVYESADYMKTLSLSDDYLHEFPDGQYKKELAQLVDITQQRLATEAGKRPLKAEVEYQQAERAYILGEFSQSLSHLDTITRLYSDTPANEKVDSLKARVNRAMEMSRMENLHQQAPMSEVPLDQLPQPAPRSEISKIQDEMQSILDTLNSYKNGEN